MKTPTREVSKVSMSVGRGTESQVHESSKEQERVGSSRWPNLMEEGCEEDVWNQQHGAKQGPYHVQVWESTELPLEKARTYMLSLAMKQGGRNRKLWSNSLGRGSKGWGIYLQGSQFSEGPSRRGLARDRHRAM